MVRHIRSTDLGLDATARKELVQLIRKTKQRKFADRLRVVLYKADGYTHQEIATLLQMGLNQVTKILRRYLAGGVEALQSDHYQSSQPKLTPDQQHLLTLELKTTIYNTALQGIAWVEKQWGVRYELRGMHGLLKRLGFTYKFTTGHFLLLSP